MGLLSALGHVFRFHKERNQASAIVITHHLPTVALIALVLIQQLSAVRQFANLLQLTLHRAKLYLTISKII